MNEVVKKNFLIHVIKLRAKTLQGGGGGEKHKYRTPVFPGDKIFKFTA
jgi:hypothetical protein